MYVRHTTKVFDTQNFTNFHWQGRILVVGLNQVEERISVRRRGEMGMSLSGFEKIGYTYWGCQAGEKRPFPEVERSHPTGKGLLEINAPSKAPATNSHAFLDLE